MTIIKLILLMLLNSLVYASYLVIDESTKHYDLMPHSDIYIDYNKSLTLEDIQKMDDSFIENEESTIGFGYSPDFHVWIKFTIQNSSDTPIEKVLEYDNTLTSNVSFFDPDLDYEIQQDGLFHIRDDRKTINPIFKIRLNPKETKTYYIKASSYITTLIVKLNIWDINSFYHKEMKYQLILSLFFGAMIVLAVYNLFIFIFTKDINYFYYVLYIIGILIHQAMYRGIANIYIIDPESIAAIIKYATFIVGFPAIALALFTKSFLRIKQYPLLNKLLNIYLILFPLLLAVFIITDEFNKYRNIFSVVLLIILVAITTFSAFKRNRQALFLLFGWSVFLAAGIFMYLSSVGIYKVYTIFPYYVELSLVVEAIIFSIALADKIKELQKEKEVSDKKLITQEKNERAKLEKMVTQKTNDLKILLDEKVLLLRELNHRVKNNMQTIVSLIRLQADKIDDEKISDIFTTIQNRINAMNHLHNLLYKQDDSSYVNTYDYFELIIDEVIDCYDNDSIDINSNITANLDVEEAVYCGLILNELITNSFKYAFRDIQGAISISLKKEDDKYIFLISDNGIGYDQYCASDSVGLALVNTLAKEQLKGSIKTDSKDGVKVLIIWGNHV